MKPFSALYFIKENRMRSLMLILMFVLSYIAYIGGLYVTNIRSMFDYALENRGKYAVMYPKDEDTELTQFYEMVEHVSEEEGVTALHMGVNSSLNTKSIMGFANGYGCIAFCNLDDFRKFCRIMGIQCDFDNLKGGSMIMSRLAANNRGMQIGDRLKQEEDEWVAGNYTLDAITDEEGYTYYYIDDGTNGTNYSYILLAEGMTETEFSEYVQGLKQEQKVGINTKQDVEDSMDRQLNSFNYLYIFILVLLSVVMAVTLNAAFVGMYQHRQSEFAIYRAIGISKKQIIGKIAVELLLMDLIGIVAGGVVLLLVIYLMNHLYLIPNGLMLLYYHPLALFGMVFCNLMVLVPLLVTRSRQLLRADICDY